MNVKSKDIYVLGTGLSHDGSACLLKNGEICVAIEKERITRIKHDGGNDNAAIEYCLETEGITLNDVSLIVQNANFGSFKFGNSFFDGNRLFDDSINIPIVTISHHLAHAYYALGTSPFENTAIFVLDGCGSPYDECIDLENAVVSPGALDKDIEHLYCEKDSLYIYKDNSFKTVFKDFSPMGFIHRNYPMHPGTTKHSIGGVYAAATGYCFNNDGDAGKLMGLASFGKEGIYKDKIFRLEDGKVYLNHDWMFGFNSPARSAESFWHNFQYYADIAYWVQKETEEAIIYLLRNRKEMVETEYLSFTGGVALNAVANRKILENKIFENCYFTPAAGDNGLSIGCAYYGWLEILKKDRVIHKGISNFGKSYDSDHVLNDIENFFIGNANSNEIYWNLFINNLEKFVDEKEISKETYTIQIEFVGIGFYSIVFKEEKVQVLKSPSINSDCSIVTTLDIFISGLTDKSVFINSVNEKKSQLTGDVNYFLRSIKIKSLNDFIQTQIRNEVTFPKVKYSKETDVFKRTAELLSEGKVIAWFQGGSEFGPRALGHRSILADPRKANVQKFINNKVKFREDFRPFAPAVLREEVSNYFKYEGESPYMILTAPVREEWITKIPGVVHVDDSARIQTVTLENNEKFYKLIKEFQTLTDIPILLNTSFNKKGMPIVETPNQALAFFYECGLDCLIMEDFVITK